MKWMDTTFALVIIVAFLLFVNALNILAVYKMVLYIVGVLFLGSWFLYILAS